MKKKLKKFFKNFKKKFNFDDAVKFIIYLTVFLIPLFYLPSLWSPWEFAKAALFYLLILVAAVLWLLKMIIKKEFRFRRIPFNLWLGMFFIIYFLSSLMAINKFNSFFGNSRNLGGSLISVFFFMVFYYLVINHFKDKKSLRRLLTVLLISFFVILILSWTALITFRFWPDSSSFFNFDLLTNSAATLAVIFAFISALALSLSTDAGSRSLRYFLIIFSVLSLGLEFLLGVKAGLLTLAVLLLLLIILASLKLKFLSSRFIIIPTILLAASLILLFVPLGKTLGFNFSSDLSLDQHTAMEIARSSLAGYPLLGTGPLNFYYNFTRYKPADFNSSPFWQLTFIHSSNWWLEAAGTIGILGVLALIVLYFRYILYFGKMILREEDMGDWGEKSFLFAALLGFLIAGFFISFNWLLWFFFWLFLAVLTAADNFKSSVIKFSKSSQTAVIITLIFVIFTAGGLYFIYSAARFLAADSLFLNISRSKNGDIYKTAKKAADLNPYKSDYHLVLARETLIKAGKEKDNAPQLIIASDQEIKRALQLSPYSSLVINDAAELYWTLSSYSDVSSNLENIYKKGLEVDPNNPLIYFNLGRLYALKARSVAQGNKNEKDKDKELQNNFYGMAEKQFKKAIELKEDFSPAYYHWSILKVENGKKKEALSLMEKAFLYGTNSLAVISDLGALYIDQGLLNKALPLMLSAVKTHPNDINLHWQLAVIYEKGGENKKAIEELETVLQINPKLKQAQAKLEELKSKGKK